jgi:GDP-mannose 6-dehydrogenase
MVQKIDDVLEHSDIIVIGNGAPEFADIGKRLRPDQHVIDLVRVRAVEDAHDNYEGICW